ncbi:hypothetical protein M3Y97_01079400 [Aphelenchoides bicaudatus]|nr:hypothetical protein M3Y97_01079400 [Aphelenchoides bicaudatus]
MTTQRQYFFKDFINENADISTRDREEIEMRRVFWIVELNLKIIFITFIITYFAAAISSLVFYSAKFMVAPVQLLNSRNDIMVTYDHVYCAIPRSQITQSAVSFVYIAFIYEITLAFFEVLLLLYNKRKIRMYKRNPGSFNLNRSFNLKSMEISIEVICPASIVNALTFCLQNLAYIALITYAEDLTLERGSLIYELGNLGRISANFIVSAFILLHARYRQQRRVNVINDWSNTDAYFRQFKMMIA